MNEQVLVLAQQGMQQEERRFQLKDNRELRIARKKSSQEKEYTVSLLALAQSGQHALHFNWKWLVAAIMSLLIMLALLRGQTLFQFQLESYTFYMVVVMSLLAMVFMLLCIRTFSFDYVFYSRYAHVPLVKFMVAKPSSPAYRKFIASLETRIEELQDYMALSVDKQIAGELRTIRRLTEEGVLEKSYYPHARDQLLKLIDQNYKKNNSQH